MGRFFIDLLILPDLHRVAAARTRIAIAWDDYVLVKTAKALGLAIPQSLIATADQVIE